MTVRKSLDELAQKGIYMDKIANQLTIEVEPWADAFELNKLRYVVEMYIPDTEVTWVNLSEAKNKPPQK